MSDEKLTAARGRMRSAGFDDTPTPWIFRAVERLEPDGAYADFTGFESWFSNVAKGMRCTCGDNCGCPACQLVMWWDGLGVVDRLSLYNAFQK